MNFFLIAVLVLGAIGLIAALVLYVCSKKFAVYEDPRIAQVTEQLPGANCGGCGFAGCGGLADALVKGADAGSLEGLMCPVGGQEVMGKVADLLGMAIANGDPMVAVVRCNGTCALRPKIAEYSGLRTCAAMNSCGAGETACGFGCLGCGDCVAACQFDAIHMNPETGLPEVDEEKCVACGACVKACPRHIIELRKKGPKGRRVYVSCVNKDKGPVAMKACKAACIGCGKCEKTCPFGAITVENNLAYIDFNKCKSCRKCVDVCPTHAIIDLNFPPKPVKPVSDVVKPAADVEKKASKVSDVVAKPVSMPSAASIAALLPQANCGACGFDDCSAFAAAIVKDGGIGEKSCSVGGEEVMSKIADLLKNAPAEAPKESEKAAVTKESVAAKVVVPAFELVNIAAHPKVDVVAKIAALALANAAKSGQKADAPAVNHSPIVPIKTTGLMAPQKLTVKTQEEAKAIVDKIASTLL